MMKHLTMNSCVSVLALCLSSGAFASAAFTHQANVANAGTTGAGDGVYTKSAAALWANPATMSFMGEELATVNLTAYNLVIDYKSASDAPVRADGKSDTSSPVATAYYVNQLTDRVHLGIGLGVTGGANMDYGNQWAGKSLMTSSNTMLAHLNPSVSYRLNDQWSVGAGVQIAYGLFETSSSLMELEATSDWSVGYNLGVMYQASEELSLGLSYRSKVEHQFKDDVVLMGAVTAPLTTELYVPAFLDLSGRYQLNDKTALLGTIQWQQWSDWEYTELYIGDSGSVLSIDREWEDVMKYAVGVEHTLNADWTLKAGIAYETSPQDDPAKQWVDLPVGEQWHYSLGASTEVGDYTVDFFYEFIDIGKIDIHRGAPYFVQGQFDAQMHFAGVNFTF